MQHKSKCVVDDEKNSGTKTLGIHLSTDKECGSNNLYYATRDESSQHGHIIVLKLDQKVATLTT